ncbi:hypothetical protein JW962_03430 [Candidatus Dojkabacteria bacterium]|nr:hypothetical protein [Candidatus Dojkabacteria bacterium]
MTLSFFSTFGMNFFLSTFATKAKVKKEVHQLKLVIMSVVTVFTIVNVILLTVLLNTMGMTLFFDGFDTSIVVISFLGSIFFSIFTLINSILQGLDNFKAISFSTGIQGLISIVWIYIFFRSENLALVLCALIVSCGLGIGYQLMSLRRSPILSQERNKLSIGEIILFLRKNFGKWILPFFISGLVGIPVTWLLNKMISQTGEFEVIGVVNSILQWRNFLLLIPTVLLNAATPLITEIYIKGEDKKLKKIWVLTSLLSGFVCTLSCGIVLIGSRFITSLPDFWHNEFFVSLITAVVISATYVSGLLISISGKIWVGVKLNLFWGFLAIVGYLLLNTRFDDVESFSYSQLLAYVVHLFLTYVMMNRHKLFSNSVDQRIS